MGFEFFDELPDEKKARLVRAIIEAAINGSNVPNALIDRAKTWSKDWLKILVTEFPLLLATKKHILRSPSLVIDVLKASATNNEPLPETWKLILQVGEENKIDWYYGESWKLYESLENIKEAFKEIGKPSPELEKFIADIVPF